MIDNHHELEPVHEVRVHVDQLPCKSPVVTTGAALYELAGVPEGYNLFREVEGDREDELVPRDRVEFRLKQDEHFHIQRVFTIFVNTHMKSVEKRELSYAEVIVLAFEHPIAGPNVLYTITYRNGPKRNREGNLRKGEGVYVTDGMIFNVTPTDKS